MKTSTSHKKTSQKPLTQTGFSILLALSLKPRHGYELMQQVNDDSKGRVSIGPGGLYGTIKELHKHKYIEEIEDTDDTTARKRRHYKITEKGRGVLAEEVAYYNHAVELAQARNTAPNLRNNPAGA